MWSKDWPIDKLFLFAIIQLIAYGSLMMYSASSHIAEVRFDSHLYYLLKHLKWILIGIFLYQLISRLKYQNIKTIIPYLIIITWFIILSAFYLNPTNKPSRWLIINGSNWMTTSDLARITLIVYTAYFIDKYPKKLTNLKFMFINFTPVPLITLFLILNQPDLSSTIIIALIILSMLFVAKVSYKYILTMFMIASILFSYKIVTNDYMYNRLNKK